MRYRWIPGPLFLAGVVTALLVPYGSCLNEVQYEGGPLLWTDCANHIPLRIAIAGIAAVLALAAAGIFNSQHRRRLLTGAATLAAGLAVALLIPRGGPYYPVSAHLHGIGLIIPRYSNRNPLRVAVAATAAFTALVISFDHLKIPSSRQRSVSRGDRSASEASA